MTTKIMNTYYFSRIRTHEIIILQTKTLTTELLSHTSILLDTG